MAEHEYAKEWQAFASMVSIFRPLVMCVKCGSTNIDHKPVGRLTCFMCQNDMHWSPDRFRVVRDMGDLKKAEVEVLLERTARDFATAMRGTKALVANEMRDDADWYGDLVRAVEAFLDAVAKFNRPGDRASAGGSLREEFVVMTDRVRATIDTMGPTDGG